MIIMKKLCEIPKEQNVDVLSITKPERECLRLSSSGRKLHFDNRFTYVSEIAQSEYSQESREHESIDVSTYRLV